MAQGGKVFRRVGVLEGMAPEATVILRQRLIAAIPAADDADHVPLIVDQNPQVSSRLRRLIDGTGEDPAPVLAGMAQRLQGAGAEALAMPCNTAHHYAAAIRSAVSIPLLDIVTLSVARARELAGAVGKVSILASPAMRQIGLFDAAGLNPVFVKDDAAMLSIIRRIKAQGRDENSRAALRCRWSPALSFRWSPGLWTHRRRLLILWTVWFGPWLTLPPLITTHDPCRARF